MRSGTLLRTLASVFGCYAYLLSPVWAHGTDDHHSDRIEQTIEPDDIYELCLVLTPQQQLHYAFTATGKLNFNVHYHGNDEVLYPVADH